MKNNVMKILFVIIPGVASHKSPQMTKNFGLGLRAFNFSTESFDKTFSFSQV